MKEGFWPHGELMVQHDTNASCSIYPLLQKLHIEMIPHDMTKAELTGLLSFSRANPSIEALSIGIWRGMTGVLSSPLEIENFTPSERVMSSAEAASEDASRAPNGTKGKGLDLADRAKLLPNLQTLSITRGFTEAELELDPASDLSPSTLIRAALVRSPNLHISVGLGWQHAHKQLIGEDWPPDLGGPDSTSCPN